MAFPSHFCASFMFFPCTFHVLSVHFPCPFRVISMHSPCPFHALFVRYLCLLSMPVCSLCASHVLSVYPQYAFHWFPCILCCDPCVILFPEGPEITRQVSDSFLYPFCTLSVHFLLWSKYFYGPESIGQTLDCLGCSVGSGMRFVHFMQL